ncbi:MAG: helix-turn-helix transcriptional regulator [Clostridia bacterium]|nr:helix-turn-helix transcriptional regulator [Clostridia bacterium]
MLRLKELRLQEKMTQKELAEKIGAAWYNIGDWERGKSEPSIADLIKIADFFDCTVDHLIGREHIPNDLFMLSEDVKKEKSLLLRYRALDEAGKDFVQACVLYASEKQK